MISEKNDLVLGSSSTENAVFHERVTSHRIMDVLEVGIQTLCCLITESSGAEVAETDETLGRAVGKLGAVGWVERCARDDLRELLHVLGFDVNDVCGTGCKQKKREVLFIS